MKTKKIIILIVIAFAWNPFSFNITFWNNSDKFLDESYIDDLDDWIEKIEESKRENLEANPYYKTKSSNNKAKYNNKKLLKKEIQNRKKYHRSLLNIYNQNFDKNYLELIKNNSILLDNFKKKL